MTISQIPGGGELLDSSHESKNPYISEMVRDSVKMVTYKKELQKTGESNKTGMELIW